MANPQYWFQTDNSMYWSSDFTAAVYNSDSQTMALTQTKDKTNIFEMNGTGGGGGKKYLVGPDGAYLQWQMVGDVAAITKSKYNISKNDWNSIPAQDQPQLTFVFQTVDSGNKFRLYISSPVKNKLYLKRVLGTSQYIVATNQYDSFGIFTKSLYTPSN